MKFSIIGNIKKSSKQEFFVYDYGLTYQQSIASAKKHSAIHGGKFYSMAYLNRKGIKKYKVGKYRNSIILKNKNKR